MSEVKEREKVIVRTSMTGILTNLFLVVFKMIAGLLAHSIAVVLDAVNNLSDALSSIITIVGVKLAGKAADAKHPLGHGRIEYLSALAVACLVLYAGITSLVESIKKIINPSVPDYSALTLVIIAVGVVTKIILGTYFKKTGQKVNSNSLVASGEDARFDAILSFSVFVCALIYIFTDVSLEAYVGAAIAVFIIKSGVEMLRDTVDDLLGTAFDRDLTHNIKTFVKGLSPDIMGAYDLILHSYGPDHTVGSIHIAVKDTTTAEEIDALSRKIAAAVYARFNVLLVGVGIYSYNTKNDEAAEMRSKVTHIVMSHEGVIQLHGFYVDIPAKQMSFDMIIDWNIKDREALYRHIREDVQKEYPGWQIHTTLDINV
jgi:cation diffusion facilitator family transporter